MSVDYYSTKVEFQGRGAGHNHGVLWVNLDKMEYYFEKEKDKWVDFDSILKEFEPKKKNSSGMKETVKRILQEIVEYNSSIEDDKKLPILEDDINELFTDLLGKKNCQYEISHQEILGKFPLFGISSAFRKCQTLEKLQDHEEKAVKRFANKFTICTLNKAKLEAMTEDPILKQKTAELLDIIEAANIHKHTQTCRKYETICRFGFGKFPIWETLIAKPASTVPKETMERYSKILKDVREVLDNDSIISNILEQYPDRKNETLENYEKNRRDRIIMSACLTKLCLLNC